MHKSLHHPESSLEQLRWLFNAGLFYEAQRACENEDAFSGRGPLRFLYEVISAYRQWDEFDYSAARAHLQAGTGLLPLRISRSPGQRLQEFLDHLHNDLIRLSRLVVAVSGPIPLGENRALRIIPIDLIASAARRAELHGYYGDAVMRLYSALEKLAKAELESFGIDNSQAAAEMLPAEVRADYTRRYISEKGRLKFGLQASLQLLVHLGSDLGEHFLQHRKQLTHMLNKRHDAMLVHGLNTVSEKDYKELKKLILSLGRLQDDEIRGFPRMTAEFIREFTLTI